MITALLYTRVSSDEQATSGLSLDTQLAECRQYALRQGWALGEEFVDILSGTRDDRPQYQAMLEAARTQRGEVAVVVAALDRLGRRLMERIRCREELKALGVAVHSVREGGEVSDLVANVLGAVAQEEVRRLGERVRASRRYMASLGWKPPGRAAYGYLWRAATPSERATGAPNVVLDLDERSAPSMAEAFTRVADGTSLRRVTAWLRELPEQERAGRRLPNTVVSYLMRAPVYVARPDHGDADVLARPRARWPALVPDDVWARAQGHIADHEHHHHQSTGQYLLVGFFRCPMCGKRPVGNTDVKHSIKRYRCSAMSHGDGSCLWSLRVTSLDGPVLRTVAHMLRRIDSAVSPVEWDQTAQPVEIAGYRGKRLASLRGELTTLTERHLRAAQLYVDGAIESAGYTLLRDDTQRQMVAAESEIARLDAADTGRSIPALDHALSQVPDWAATLASPDTTTADLRALLGELVAAVDVQRIPPDPGHVKGIYTTRVQWTPIGALLHRIGATRRASVRAV